MLEELVMDYPITPNKILAERYNVSENTLRCKARKLNLRKISLYRSRYSTWTTVMKLFGKASVKQMAREAGVCERTILRICKQLNLKLDKDDRTRLIKDAVNKRFRSERRRQTYGFEPLTDRRIGISKSRQKVAKLLGRSGYIVMKNSWKIYYGPDMQRNFLHEEEAKAYGFQIVLWDED